MGPQLYAAYQILNISADMYISYSVSVKHKRALCECAPEGWSLAPQQINTQTSYSGQCWRMTHCLSVKVPLNPGRLEKHWTKHYVVHPYRKFGPITQIGFLFRQYLIALSSASIHEAVYGPLRSGRCRSTEMKQTLIELFAHNLRSIDLFCWLRVPTKQKRELTSELFVIGVSLRTQQI